MEFAFSDVTPAAFVVLVVGGIALACAGYAALCVYFVSRADRCLPRVIKAVPEGQGAVEPMPYNWLVPAAAAVLLGFTPCALASLVHASRVATYHRAGDADAACKSARFARVWFCWSAGVGMALIALFSALPMIAVLVGR